MSQEELKPQKNYYPDGTLKYEALFNARGVPEGRIVQYYSNGQKMMESFMVDGKNHGEVKSWDREGNLIDRFEVENGTGPFRTWYGNGRKKAEGQIRDGLFIGALTLWDEDGKKLCTTYHIKGGEVKKQKYLGAMEKDPTLPPID